MNYLVSILVPIYGVEKYIEKCVISLFKQTYDNIEYVFVDDCSPDKSVDILQSIVNRHPNRKDKVKIIRHEHNMGLATARNTAVAASNGVFLIHMDSDDWIELDLVEKCVRLQTETNSDIILYGYTKHVHQKKGYKIPLNSNSSKHLVERCVMGTFSPMIWNKMIRKSLYNDNELKCLNGINMGEDLQISPLLYFFSKKTSVIQDCLYHYNCMNTNAYTQKFSIEKSEQAWISLSVVTYRLINIDSSYKKYAEIGKLRFIAKTMVAASINREYDFLNLLKKRYKECDSSYVSSVFFPYRLEFYIDNNYLLTLYSKVMKKIKNLL